MNKKPVKKLILNMIIIFCLFNIIISLLYFFELSKQLFKSVNNLSLLKFMDFVFLGRSLFLNNNSCNFMIYFIGSFIALAISASALDAFYEK